MSLRTRLTLYYVTFFAAALLILDIGLFVIVRHVLISSIDNELRLGAQLLQRGFTESNQMPPAFFNGESMEVLLRKPPVRDFETTSLYIRVYDQSQTVVANSPNLESEEIRNLLLSPAADVQRAIQGEEVFLTIDNGPLHMRALLAPLIFRNPVSGQEQIVGVLQVMRSKAETDRALTLLSYTLVVGGLIVLVAAARGGAWLTREAFRPIDEITHTAQSIVRAEDLSRRVPVPDVQDELQRLSVTVNHLLQRMEQLFQTQQRFVADVSHELRTPLAAMQGNLDVLARGAVRNPALLEESLTDMRREVARLIRMVNDLLLLARTDTGLEIHREPVDLDTLLLELHRELRPLATHVQLQLHIEATAQVIGDRDRIKQALLNLSANALQYTPPHGTVTLHLDRHAGYALLEVQDTGIGIAMEDQEHIFDRFFRADRSRSRNQGGAGLGLAIVKWVADVHGGRVQVQSTPGQGSTFGLLLPLAPGQAEQVVLEPAIAGVDE